MPASQDEFRLRRLHESDHEPCAEIISEAFTGVANRHGFPSAAISLDVARLCIVFWTASPDTIEATVAVGPNDEPAGIVILLHSDDIWAVKLVAVSARHQGHGVGRKLVQHCIDSFRAAGRPHALRLTQDSFNTTSFSLYLSMGFNPLEGLTMLTAPDGFDFGTLLPDEYAARPADHALQIRPMTSDDVATCDALFQKCHGSSRRGEIAAVLEFAASSADDACIPHVVVDRQGTIVGYSTGLDTAGHTVCESEEAFRIILGHASAINRDEKVVMYFLGLRYPDLLRWLLSRKLKISKLGTMMGIGPYSSPKMLYVSSASF
eukprot:TRINITY_DN22861_c0_g1_i1.p1 TRINITY_DN22861_c0_g1~~TRINITY_DN22861_c0_g1_i1.p1  ORF type:complete len:320 (+),score=89.71 TRINITY_DN22861_c0_g1_i1:453-1412(+)